MYACMHASHIHLYIHVYTCVCVYMYMDMYICIIYACFLCVCMHMHIPLSLLEEAHGSCLGFGHRDDRNIHPSMYANWFSLESESVH